MDLYGVPPPHHRHKFSRLGVRLATTRLLNTKRHQSAGIPKSSWFAHSDSSRSSRSACIPERAATFPVGIFKSSATFTGVPGRRILPAATSRSSSSLPSPEKGTSLATGRFRSRMTISSPPLGESEVSAQPVLEFRDIDAAHSSALPCGDYSHVIYCAPENRILPTPSRLDCNGIVQRVLVRRSTLARKGFPVSSRLQAPTTRAITLGFKTPRRSLGTRIEKESEDES